MIDQTKQEGLLFAHSDVAGSTRLIAKFLIEKIADSITDEQKFYKLIHQSDRASLTLQRLCSILTQLIPLEHNILSQQLDMMRSSPDNKQITREDCELIINIVRQWGLLKEDSDDDIDKIIDQYEQTTDVDHE